MKTRRQTRTALLDVLGQTLLEGPGETSPAVRVAAAAGTGRGALGTYARQVQAAAYKVTPEQMAQLQKAQSDDALFEVTICAAFGAAKQRHDAALALLDAAWETES